MPDKTSLGDRMKKYYEERFSKSLPRRIPVIIRLDGKAFHTFTRGLHKPFSQILIKTMQETARDLCKAIQGTVFAYSQSDEISLLLKDWDYPKTEAWFDYNVQKMCSVSASMATASFNKNFKAFDKDKRFFEKYDEALFDSRVFSIPKEDARNYFIWRQQDATRNSLLSVARANFSHRELQGKKQSELHDMLFSKGLNFSTLPSLYRRGFMVEKITFDFHPTDGRAGFSRGVWTVNDEIPIFTDEVFRDYMEYHLA